MRVPVLWIFTISVTFCVLCSLVIAKKKEHNIEERDTEVAEVLQLEHDLKRVKRLQDFRDQEQELERVKRVKRSPRRLHHKEVDLKDKKLKRRRLMKRGKKHESFHKPMKNHAHNRQLILKRVSHLQQRKSEKGLRLRGPHKRAYLHHMKRNNKAKRS